MRKIAIVSVAAASGLLALLFGPALSDGLKLQSYISDSTDLATREGGPWPRVSDVCTTCHGLRGNAINQDYPGLAGQPKAYVAAQLHAFASGQRVNPTMGPLAQTMGEPEIASLADYFSRQKPEPNAYFKPDPQLRDRGERLVQERGCAACHGEALTGQGQFPRLAGQGSNYMVRQLDAFAAGTRTEPGGTMKTLATAASPEDRKAMASYLASLPSTRK